jgi:hypothetical protein
MRGHTILHRPGGGAGGELVLLRRHLVPGLLLPGAGYWLPSVLRHAGEMMRLT